MTRRRKVTFKEGQLKVIADVFIAGVLHNKPRGWSTARFMDHIFNVDTRHVVFCAAANDFVLDGGIIPTGTRLLLRHDVTMPELFELALLSDADNVSRLTARQWSDIRRSIKLTDKAGDEARRFFA